MASLRWFTGELGKLMTLPLIHLSLAKSPSTIESIVRKDILLVAGRQAGHYLMDLQGSWGLFYECFAVGDRVADVAFPFRKQFKGGNTCPNTNKRTDVLFHVTMFVENVVVGLVAGVIGPKATIFELNFLGNSTAAFLNRDGGEIHWGS